jgi:Arc/MetJ-type ribon-helix-helix transcriptional regulator
MATATEGAADQIREAVQALRETRLDSQRWHAATTALVSELARAAVSDADQETRVRLVTEAAATFEASQYQSGPV